MLRFTVLLSLLGSLATGCAAQRPLTPEEAQARTAMYQEQNRCLARLEVFMPGMQPTRPYRVLGPIEANWGWSAESRFSKLKTKACEMGASAIIDAGDHVYTTGTALTVVHRDRWGRPVTVVEGPAQTQRNTSAIAIVYTDQQPAAAPAAAQTSSTTTSGGVLIQYGTPR